MSYQGFVWRNGTRNKRRMILTITSVALALFVMVTLMTFVNEIERALAEANPLRVITHHAVAFSNPLPERYRAQIEKVPGVVAVTPTNWFIGTYIDEKHTDFWQFACDPRTLFQIYTELRLPPEQQKAFIEDRTGIIVGRRKAEKHGWKIGGRLTLKGMNYPADLEFTIRGVFTGNANDESQVIFQRDYLEEVLGRPGTVQSFWVRADSTESVAGIIDAIDAMFQNTDAPTKTETERAFNLGFVSMMGNLKGLVATLSSVIIFTILLVTANTMAMSVRERVREIAVLKSLGFRRGKVLGLLASEGMLITLTGGLIGCVGARVVFSFVDMATLTQNIFQRFEITWGIIALGLVISILVGLVSAVIPAYRVAKLTVADGLRHVG